MKTFRIRLRVAIKAHAMWWELSGLQKKLYLNRTFGALPAGWRSGKFVVNPYCRPVDKYPPSVSR
jgi:hypothetical protein